MEGGDGGDDDGVGGMFTMQIGEMTGIVLGGVVVV
jgi:hypothetical protein